MTEEGIKLRLREVRARAKAAEFRSGKPSSEPANQAFTAQAREDVLWLVAELEKRLQ